MKAGRFSFVSPLALTAAIALIAMSAWEWLEHLIMPEISPWGHQIHNAVFVSIASCIAAVFILRNIKARSIITSIVQSTQDGIIAIDLDGNIMSWNMGAQRIYGYSLEEVREKGLPFLLPGDRVEHMEAIHAGKDGKPIHVSLTVSPIRNAAGVVSGASIIVRDISERKRTEEALRMSEKRLRLAQDAANAGTWEWDLRSNENFWSEEVWKLYGLEPHSCKPSYDAWRATLHPEDQDRTEQLVREAAKAGAELNAEWRVRDPNGTERWLMSRGRPVLDADGQVERYIGIILDITDRKRMEKDLQRAKDSLAEEVKRQTADLVLANEQMTREMQDRKRSEEDLQQSEAKYKRLTLEFDALLNAISDSLVLLTPDMKLLWTNNAPAYHVDAPVADLTGKFCYHLFYNRTELCEDCPVARCFQTGEAETQVSNRSGMFLDKRAYPIKDGEQVSSAILLVSDITEKMAMQAEAMQANQLVALGELVAGVAHEINNPIGGIINYGQILINECGPEAMEYSIGQRIVKEGNRIAQIVKALLSFARGGREDKRPLRVEAILKESLLLTQAQLRKESIRLDIHLSDDLPDIQANFQQIQQIFLNLISNARYAIHEKHPFRHEDKVIEIRGERVTVNGGENVRMTFLDHGAGIPADKMSLLTKPFFSTKPFGKGTGLGLAISRKIVVDHGGLLSFESVEGEFTRVILELPTKEVSRG